MTLTIITGTHTFVDLSGKFRQAFSRSMQSRIQYNIDGLNFSKRRFDRVEIQKNGDIIHLPSRIFPMDRNGFSWSVSQPTGSGKTILAVYNLRQTYINGGNIQANFSYEHMKHNEGKPKDEWKPSITTINELVGAKKCHLVIDDIKGTIERWQAKEADVISMVANLGRKDSVDLDFTTQRVINFVPPNIKSVATGYLIPYITIRDLRIDTPDNKGYPREMEVLALIPADMGDVFVGFGILHGDVPDGKIITPSLELLNSYKTMEIAVGLKQNEDGIGDKSYPGYELENEFYQYLCDNYSNRNFKHCSKTNKRVYDIVDDWYAFDVVEMDDDARLVVEHKDLLKHIRTAKRKGQIGWIVFKQSGEWRGIRITDHLNHVIDGKRIKVDLIYRLVRKIETIMAESKLSVSDIPSER